MLENLVSQYMFSYIQSSVVSTLLLKCISTVGLHLYTIFRINLSRRNSDPESTFIFCMTVTTANQIGLELY